MEYIGAGILCIIAIICFIVSYRQFRQKGFLFNNAYMYASLKDKESMNKKPYYRQSGFVFMFIGIIFVIDAIEIILKTNFLFYFVIGIMVIMMIYVIVSSILIEKNNRSDKK